MRKQVLTFDDANDVTIVRVMSTRMYQPEVDHFHKELMDIVDRGSMNILVDFSRVEVINSSGLGVLIMISDKVNQGNGRFVISGLCDFLMELFERMRLDSIITLIQTEEKALKTFS